MHHDQQSEVGSQVPAAREAHRALRAKISAIEDKCRQIQRDAVAMRRQRNVILQTIPDLATETERVRARDDADALILRAGLDELRIPLFHSEIGELLAKECVILASLPEE